MGALILFLLIAAVIALIVVQIGGAIGALFFGRKLPWIWFALAVLVVVMKVVQVALYRETDGLRAIVSLAAGFLAVGLALLAQRRFPRRCSSWAASSPPASRSSRCWGRSSTRCRSGW